MNVSQPTVTNAANLLKAHFRGRKYVSETIKLLPEKPDPILLAQVFDTVARLGSIHPVEPGFNSS